VTPTPSSNTDAATQTSAAASDLPDELLVSAGNGPALYLDETPNSPAIGYISEGVVVRIMGATQGDRVPVRVYGPLKVRGWLKLDRLAARAQQRGRVDGTPTYLGPNDIVGLRGPGAEAGTTRIEVRPVLGVPGAPEIGPFTGEFPSEHLAATVVDRAAVEGPTAGEPMQVSEGTTVEVYDRPGGEVIATIPPLTPPLKMVSLRDRGEWKGVRIGVGPYLVGYVNVALSPADSAPQAPDPEAEEVGSLPARIAREGERPLWGVKEGARIRFDGRTIAIFAAAGFAREMNRYEDTGEVDVFVAVDDDIAVRGMIRKEDLVATEGSGTPAAPANEPAVDEFSE
jgi:hypothetical protein